MAPQRRSPALLGAAALGLGSAAVCVFAGGLAPAAPSFAGLAAGRLRGPTRAAATVAAASSASSGGWFDLDSLIRLPESLTEAMEGVQDMFGGQSSGPGLEAMEVSTFGMANDGISANVLFQTMTIRAAAGSERKLARQVGRLIAAAKTSGEVLTAAATQNPEDPCDFMIILRYASMSNLKNHQSKKDFKEMFEAMEPQLERPIGLYLMDEQGGEAGMGRYPFGPGGEGGRDDAIYSSRKKGR